MARQIREKTLVPNTNKAYQRGFNNSEWPLDSPFRIMAYLDKAPPSDSSFRQWMATATAIHKSRLWPAPEFRHPLVQNFIQALKLYSIFACLRQNREPTDLRNWAITIIQLFGVRRASEVLALRAKDVYLADGTFVIRIPASKTDNRRQGIFFKLQQTSVFGFDPVEIVSKYLPRTKGKGEIIFPSFDSNSKRFTEKPISVNGWNRAIKRVCLRVKIKPRSLHAFRRSVTTLSSIESSR